MITGLGGADVKKRSRPQRHSRLLTIDSEDNGEGKEKKRDDDDEDHNDGDRESLVDDDDDADDREKAPNDKDESEINGTTPPTLPRKRPKLRANRLSSQKKKSTASRGAPASAAMKRRDGVGLNAADQARDAWKLANDPLWKDAIRIIEPITTQVEFDRQISDARARGRGDLRLLLIVSRLVQTETKQVHELRRACVVDSVNKRLPKSRLNNKSEPVSGGGINDVRKAAGFIATRDVVYFRFVCSLAICALHTYNGISCVHSLQMRADSKFLQRHASQGSARVCR